MVVCLNPGAYRMYVENGVPAYGKTRAGITRWQGGSGDGVGGNTPPPAIKPGKWSGPGNGDIETCLNVSSDGKKLTPSGSNCPDAVPFNILGPFSCGLSLFGDNQLSKDVPINSDGTFTVQLSKNAPFATSTIEVSGTFTGSKVTGKLKETLALSTPPRVLECEWSATPNP